MFSFTYNNSFLQMLNPLTKIITIAILSSILLYFNDNINILLFSSLAFILILILGKISLLQLAKIIKPFIILFIFILIIRVIFNSEGNFVIPNIDMLIRGVINTTNFIFIFLFSALLSYASTSPSNITKALFFFIRPFSKPLKSLNITSKDIAISILVAVRFFPIIFEEANNIINSQKVRNIYKPSNLLKLELFLIPLFSRVFYYANEIAITLSLREDISTLRLQKLKIKDIIFLFILLIYCGCFIIGAYYGIF